MLQEIVLAIIQAVTEFLPISSDGHLALISHFFNNADLGFFVLLHFASLLAVLIFIRKELAELLRFKKETRKMWIYLVIGITPAGLTGLFFNDYFEAGFSSLLITGLGFLVTGTALFLTKLKRRQNAEINWKNSLFIGFMQIFSLLPGVSRSGITVSAGIFSGVEREKAFKFSFLMFIPLVLGALILEVGSVSFNFAILLSFIVCFFLSLLALNLLAFVIRKNYFWAFSIYCWIIGIISLGIYFS